MLLEKACSSNLYATTIFCQWIETTFWGIWALNAMPSPFLFDLFFAHCLVMPKVAAIHISVYAPFCKKVGIFAHVNGLLPQHRISLYHRISYTMFPLQNWSWWTIVEHDILMITRNLGKCANVSALKRNATKIEIWMNFILHFCVSGHDVKQ